MSSLASNLRKDLENAVKQARRAAETGAGKALDLLAVGHHEPWASLTPEQRKLRNRLRAHGRQLGDSHDAQRGTQAVTRLTGEVAYEHWHRMLFARFLAENDLLIEPQSGVAITLDECREMAREQGQDWLPVACAHAEGMLPQIFRRGDPVLEVSLPPETRSELEDILKAQPREVFLADDSLGWVYQFWQADRKDEVNNSEKKIGADELPAVTQLFTEDYMVEFLLHNTLGAWWAGKIAQSSSLHGETEATVRQLVALPGITWTYLRFVKDTASTWRPAAGIFEGWPKEAKALRVLDPCMGSGHFPVFALPILVALRCKEEGLSLPEAVSAVLRDNLFGLEIDPRCTQIAAFNLALAAWKLGGYQPLPPLHLACSGLSVGAEKAAWLKLADRASARSLLAGDPQLFSGGGDLADNLRQHLRFGMDQLYDLFKQAPILGSLLNPRRLHGEGLLSRWDELRPLLEEALAAETGDDEAAEIAVAAKGLSKAAEILAGQFTFVATNVPYLGRGKQDKILQDYCERVHPKAKADLATCFVERCLDFCPQFGSNALVTPQNWWALTSYSAFRASLLKDYSFELLATLGEEAWQSFGDRGPIASLLIVRAIKAQTAKMTLAVDALPQKTIAAKVKELAEGDILSLRQGALATNPDSRIVFAEIDSSKLLTRFAKPHVGFQNGDTPRYIRSFWEIPILDESQWRSLQMPPNETDFANGLDSLISADFENGNIDEANCRRQSSEAFGSLGVLVKNMRDLSATRFWGGYFDQSSTAICCAVEYLPALWCFIESPDFQKSVRQVESKVNVTPASFGKIPFDIDHWQRVAEKKYPHGLPKPLSNGPTQWLFNGQPDDSKQPLQVAVARLLDYQWPRQSGTTFPDCPALKSDGLEGFADKNGIVCLSATKGEAPAADRLNALLAAAFGSRWSSTKAHELLAATDSEAKTLADWLSDDFFKQHCDLFHQRPFIWHIWDGLKGGFNALVNYHRLAASDGSGKRTLEKLIYTYLGDWIDAQRKAQRAGTEGADARVTAAEHLRRQLEAILAGEPPFDLFIRWKPLHEQPVGWNPDINDGVRLNIRPFITAKPLNVRGNNACILRTTPKMSWDKDRGKEPQRAKIDFPWFWSWDETSKDFNGSQVFDGNRWNDCHYSPKSKLSHNPQVHI